MKLSRVKIAVLAAVLLLGMVAIPIFAACPPGTETITVDSTITTAGTYCVPAVGVDRTGPLTVAASNVTIVGETPSARLTGTAGAPVITVEAGRTNVVIHNLTIVPGADQTGIDFKGGDGTIQAVTFDGATTNFGNAVELSGINTVVRNNTFKMTAANNLAAIKLQSGSMGARISDNEVDGNDAVPAFFIENASTTPYNELQAWNNTIDQANVLIGGVGGYINSVIRDNTASTLQDHGINLVGNSTNTQVLRNVFTYGANGGTDKVGIRDRGGSNNEYRDNRITADTNAHNTSNAIEVASSNVAISGNRIDASDGGDAIDAKPASGATNATITNNTILGAGGAGILMTDTANSNFTITGNSFANIAGKGINNDGGGTNHVISNNTFINVTDIGIDSGGNNTISGNTLTGITADGIKSGVNDQVTGNTINSVSAASGTHGINVAGSNALISGNQINSVSGGGHGILLAGGNSQITNNTIDTVSGGGEGILLASSNQTITGNTIRNILTGGVGIDVQTHSNNALTNNTILNVSQDGIRVQTASNNALTNNTITNAAKDATVATPFAGIRLTYDADNTVIDGNTIVNPGSTVYAVGIDVGGDGSDNNDITNNTVRGFTTVTGASTTVSTGIILRKGMNSTLVGNTVKNTGNMRVGIEVLTPKEVPVKNNTIEGMTDVGLMLRGGTVTNPLLVQGNTLTGNVTGISMEAGASEITDGNKVYGGATALMVTMLGNAATFDLHGNCFDAPILARNDGLGKLDATGNYWATTPQTGVNVFGNVNFSGALASCPGGPPPGKSHTYGAAAGWYMVSVPLNSGTPSALFGTIAYRWNCATGVYDIVSMIEPKFGYWVSLPANKSVTDSGSQVTSDVTISISCTGWHQISAPWSYPKSAIRVIKGADTKTWADAVTAGWVRDTIYTYAATTGAYTTPSTMNPWYGYWVRANVSGLSLKLLYASGTPVSAGFAPMGPKALVVPADLPPMPPSPSVGADDLEFGNYPNPVTDVYTTTFAVKGAMAVFVEAIKVQIFDLSGRLVYEAEEAGASLDWHTDSDYGEYLANGVYLYKLYALVNGEWVVSEVKKLAILR